MAKYLLNKQELHEEGKAVVVELMEEMMYCNIRTPEQWLAHYVEAVNELDAVEFMEYIDMVATDLVACGEDRDNVKDDGTLYALVESVLLNEAFKVVRKQAQAVA